MSTESKLMERLDRIHLVMTLTEMATEFEVNSPQTILNWISKPEHIPAGKIDKIKALHVKLRSKINRSQQWKRQNGQ